MRASVLHGPRNVELAEFSRPEPAAGEVLIDVTSVGVCGSDVHYYEHGRIGRFVVEAPLVLGHEASGTVAALGEGVSNLRVGQRVSVEPGVPDLTCTQCLAGRYNLCPHMRFFATPPIDGAFAEQIVQHHAFVHPVPDGVSDDAAALLEPLSVGVWSCRKGEIAPGSRVLVTGAGPIGLVALQTALAFGATSVVVSDVNPARLELARSLGATEIVDARSGSVLDVERADVLLECSGFPLVLGEGIRSLRPAGRAVLVGMGGDDVLLPVSTIQERELRVTGTFRYANTWPAAIALAESGRVDLDSLVTGHFGLADAEAALTAGHSDGNSVKVMVHPNR